jgi:hypothetical protein
LFRLPLRLIQAGDRHRGADNHGFGCVTPNGLEPLDCDATHADDGYGNGRHYGLFHYLPESVTIYRHPGRYVDWQDYNPSDYPNYVHIGTPPVIGADGVIYGLYGDPSIADATIALSKATAEWTTSVVVSKDVTGLYVLVSVETRQSKYFVSHVIDFTNKLAKVRNNIASG